MSDATLVRGQHDMRLVAANAVAAGECWQIADGRAAVYAGQNAAASGDRTAFTTTGQFTMPRTASIVTLDGGRAYWDASASLVHFKKVNDRDFYLGRFIGDSASADTTCVVNLNVDPRYDIEVNRDPCLSVTAGTAAAGGFGFPIQKGGAETILITSTNEAQKCDLMSVDGWAPGTANAIVEFAFRVISGSAAGTVVDVSLGIANGTNATDADAITEHCFIHMDAGSTKINAQSKDGTTTVTSTDTTLTVTAGSALASRVEVWMDTRIPGDVQIYVNGVLVLGSTVFDLSHATGPEFLLFHVEKTSSTDTYEIALDWMRARFAEQ